jgi:Flp pilus assembly pilin Flp
MNTTRRRLFASLTDEHGQTLSEYSILVALIAVVVIAALPGLAAPLRTFFASALQVLGG